MRYRLSRLYLIAHNQILLLRIIAILEVILKKKTDEYSSIMITCILDFCVNWVTIRYKFADYVLHR